MATKNVQIGLEARKALLEGAQAAAKAIAVTYGPHGRTVMLDRPMGLISTRDGVTVAREVGFEEPLQNLGAKILTEACVTVNDEVGDGTTTTAILAAEMLAEGHKLVVAGFDPNQLSLGMLTAARKVADFLMHLAIPVTSQSDLETVANLASNGDTEIARLLAEACMAVGKDGTILIEDGHGIESSLELKEGMEIDRGACSSAFLPAETQERVMDGPLVAVINRHLRTMDDVQDLLECATQWPRDLLVIAQSVEGEALSAMVVNDQKGVKKSCAVISPGFAHHKEDYLKDIAALSGATFVDPAAGFDLQTWDPEWFGALRQAIIQPKKSTFVAYEEIHESLDEYMASLRARMGSTTSDYDRDKLRERLAKLAGGLAVVKVGGVTEPAMKERRARVEDALGALKAALQGGLVPGAGTAHLLASRVLDFDRSNDFYKGFYVVQSALRKPLHVLVTNAGGDAPYMVEKVVEALKPSWEHDPETGNNHYTGQWLGWDARTGDVRDLRTAPQVVTPALVEKSAILAATSVAATLLTVEVSLTLSRSQTHEG